MPIVTKQLREGRHYVYQVLAVGERTSAGNRVCPTLEFYQIQRRSHPRQNERRTALHDTMARRGNLGNETRFKHLTDSDGIFEFKTVGGLRLFCFFDETRLILCTHGTLKKGRKTPPGEIAAAEQWKRRYFAAKASHQLCHEPEHP